MGISINDRMKKIIFDRYPNIYDFDIKSVNNGGDIVNLIITFRTSFSQLIPIRVKISIDKKNDSDTLERIYHTKAEKIQALKEDRLDVFLTYFLQKNWIDDDVNTFIEDNKDILKSDGTQLLNKEEIIKVLNTRKEQLTKQNA